MAGNLPSADFMHEEQQAFDLVGFVPSPLTDSHNLHKIVRRFHHFSHPSKRGSRAFYTLFIITFLLFATLTLLECRFVISKQMEAGSFVRRLATKNDEEEKDLLQNIMELCGIIPGSEAPLEGEEAVPLALLPEPSAGPSEAAPETEEPRKKKRKTKWLEQKETKFLPGPAKKARVPLLLLPKQPAMTTPEEPVAGPSFAVLQGGPLFAVSKLPASVSRTPALPPVPLAGRDIQPKLQPVWAPPPSKPESAIPLQDPHTYFPMQKSFETAKILTPGEGAAAQAAVLKAPPAGIQFRGDFPSIFIGPSESGAPATQPLTTASAGLRKSVYMVGQHLVPPEPESSQMMLPADQERKEPTKVELLFAF